MSQFSWYMDALAGTRGDFDPRDPPSGYFRSRDRSLAVWRDDAGKLAWLISAGMTPRNLDQLCDTFAFFAPNPISYEVWDAHRQTGRWPEDPTEAIEAVRAEQPRSNNAPEHEVVLDEIAAVRAAYDAWLAEIGGTISSQAEDDRCDSFCDRMGALQKRAEDAHEVEKEPFLKGGREVDARWREAKERPKREKKEMAAPALPFRLERKRLADEAERQAREAAIEARRQAGSVNAPPVPVQMPRRAAGRLRPQKLVVIDDLSALCTQLAGLENPDIRETAERVARRMLEAGAVVHGAHLEIKQVAA